MHGCIGSVWYACDYVLFCSFFLLQNALDGIELLACGLVDGLQLVLDSLFCHDGLYFCGFAAGTHTDPSAVCFPTGLKRRPSAKRRHAIMGSGNTKQDGGDREDTGEEYQENGGFHVLELHMPSVGTGSLLILALIGIGVGAYYLRRRAKRRNQRRIERKIERKYERTENFQAAKENHQFEPRPLARGWSDPYSPKAAVAALNPIYDYGRNHRFASSPAYVFDNNRFEDVTEFEPLAPARPIVIGAAPHGRNQPLAALAPPPAAAHLPRPVPAAAGPQHPPAADGRRGRPEHRHDHDRVLDAAAAAAAAPPQGVDGNRNLDALV